MSYKTYQTYLALKSHFYTKSYDVFKYKGKVKSKYDSYQNRRDKSIFEYLSKKFNSDQLVEFFLSNFLESKNGGLYDDNAKLVYVEWKKRIENLSYLFKEDLKKILSKNKNVEKSLEFVDNQHSNIIKMYLGKKIMLETLIILDMIYDYKDEYDEVLKNDIVWEELSLKMKKYKPFLNLDKEKFIELVDG